MAQPALGELHQRLQQDWSGATTTEESARRQWWAALQVIQEDFSAQLREGGVWLAAPLPALYEPNVLQALQGWVWVPERISPWTLNLPLLPGQVKVEASLWSPLALQPEDGHDPFLVLVTRRLQLAISLRQVAHQWEFLVRFDGTALSRALELLVQRLLQEDPRHGMGLRGVLEQLGPVTLADNLGSERRFWSALACRLAAMPPSLTVMASPAVPEGSPDQDGPDGGAASTELEFLEALSHSIRTPLATIRVLSRTLRRRTDLGEDMQRPDIMSDPLLLTPMLAGVVERFAQELRSGTTLRVILTQAGGNLRLQLRGDSQKGRNESGETHLGTVLTWKPETGRLHLSRSAIRQLFSSLGGRMAERGPQQLTLFFPLA